MRKSRFMTYIGGAALMMCLCLSATGCHKKDNSEMEKTEITQEEQTEERKKEETTQEDFSEEVTTEEIIPEATTEEKKEDKLQDQKISWDSSWEYAEFSKIHDSDVMLYRSKAENRKDFVVSVNAGHGTEGGGSVKTRCHPDGSPKVTGGTTSEGATEAIAVSSGTTLNDGTEESSATLSAALILKNKLLEDGFDVLMIREEEDTQLDNIARTVISNENADCHIAIHYDGTENDKGAFYISIPDVSSYRSMEPVASHWEEHIALGDALIEGMEEEGVKIFSDGHIEGDLTQTSFSTIPSVDVEIGDAGSPHGEETQSRICEGLLRGVREFYESTLE